MQEDHHSTGENVEHCEGTGGARHVSLSPHRQRGQHDAHDCDEVGCRKSRQVVQMNRFHENGQHLVGQQLTAFDHVEGTLCQRTLGLDYFSLAARS